MTPNASSANLTAVGSSLTNWPSGPLDWVDAGVPVEPDEPERVDPPRRSADEDSAGPPAVVPVTVCPDCPEEPRAPVPGAALPVARRLEPTGARGRVADAEPPATDGAADCDVGAADAVDAEGDGPRDGRSGRLPTGVLTVGVRTGLVGSDGVLTDGVVRLGVLTWGVVTGPTVTEGTVTDGTLTVGTLTVGVVTVGSFTVGTVIDGTDTVGTDTAHAAAAAMAIAPQTARTASRDLLTSLLATRVEVEHRPTTGPLHTRPENRAMRLHQGGIPAIHSCGRVR